MDLTNKALPNTVTVGGKTLSIYTDYRIWIRFCAEYENRDINKEWDIRYLFKNELPTVADINGILDFAYPKSICPKSSGSSSNVKLFDYEIDADIIYSSFYQQYGIDLIDINELHWHKFNALFNGLNKHTRMSEVISYRSYKKSNKKMEQIYEELRNSWELPERISEDKAEELEEWNKW